jgi:hypothetical protein
MRIEENTLTNGECERLVQSAPEGAFNDTRLGHLHFTYLTADENLLETLFGTGTEHSSCEIPIFHVLEASKPHQDRCNDEDSNMETYGTIVDEEVILLFLNDNPNAFFHYGEEKIPLKCGTKLVFHGGYTHHVEVNSGVVKFLGPVTSSTCSFVGCGGGAGDPHIKKWNGESYDYHGECDLVLVSSPHFGSGAGLDMHVRTKIVDTWSFISSAAVKIGTDVLEVTNRGRLWVNGEKKVPTPTTLSSYHVSYKPSTNQK